ncbi:NlpC/P60 family protein [Hydrotalea sp.]|uniref:C40 family peptidase n=1 Tax=Hydrotalea sp. TaxID=2881279 RepID=UPI00261E325B|nr:NlpC/P60 family protein [Hydrotalea sp.]
MYCIQQVVRVEKFIHNERVIKLPKQKLCRFWWHKKGLLILQAMYRRYLSFCLIVGTVLVATGCKTLRKITAHDNSLTTASKSVKSGNPEFIDGIEIAPGSVVNSRHKTSTTKINTLSSNHENNSRNWVSIEKVNWLQMKYAIIMDATVEKLTDIPLLQKIDEWWGTNYCLGGSTKACIDCSAFTYIIMRDVYEVNLPRTAQEQYNICTKIPDDSLQEGDLVFFHTGGRRSRAISHVGVYVANNKFANASSSGGVTISDLNDPYWKRAYRGAGRVR